MDLQVFHIRIIHFSSSFSLPWLYFLFRLILNDLGLGMSHEMVLDLIHPNANMIFILTSSLWVVSNECQDHKIR